MKHLLLITFYLPIFFGFLFFSGCQFSEESLSSEDRFIDDPEYEPAERNYSSGRRIGRRRGGGGGSSSVTTNSIVTPVCERDEVIQSAVICQLLQSGELSILDSQGQQKGCDDINDLDLQSNCTDITQAYLDTIEELRIDEDLEISYENFSGLTNLQYLFLIDVDLEDIPSAVFSDLFNLVLLDLSNNEISDLTDGVFSGLYSLEELSLSRNELSDLPAGIFSNLSSLEILDLSDNEFKSPINNFYSSLTYLEELDLSGNDDLSQSDKDNIESAFSGNTDIEIIFD